MRAQQIVWNSQSGWRTEGEVGAPSLVIEAAGAELGSDTVRLGFYLYGEISPHAMSGLCELHNQTMTITALAEAA
jgi:hypothetical protein